ncbi:MAG TPA: hypothetical protein VNO17_03595 [Actinomycetota bacterium]|nr:hypothetical protein [Actinomycetota bacterium]
MPTQAKNAKNATSFTTVSFGPRPIPLTSTTTSATPPSATAKASQRIC